MAVLTIFNHGTGFNRAKGVEANEMVGWLHTHVVGNEARIDNATPVAGNHIINEGPGSSSGGIALPSEVNPMTGRGIDDEATKFGKAQGVKRSAFARAFAGQSGGGKSAMAGNISGHGWNENVQRTVQIIQTLKFEGLYDVTHVNMVGWSRGAVTSIRIANKLYEVFGNGIVCNIFGLDPVAGQDAGLTMQDTQVLPPSVQTYVAVLAMNEQRSSFAPQDMSRMQVTDPTSTTTCFLPMPGVHNEQVMGRSGVSTEPQANISRNLAFAFLQHFGTAFDARPAPAYISASAMCGAYAEVRLGTQGGQYHNTSGLKNKIVGLGLGQRAFTQPQQMVGYVAGGGASYWVNEHHRACFKEAYPELYRKIFRSNGVRDSQLEAAVGVEATTPLGRSLVGMGYLHVLNHRLMVQLGAGRYVGRPNANLWPGHLPKF